MDNAAVRESALAGKAWTARDEGKLERRGEDEELGTTVVESMRWLDKAEEEEEEEEEAELMP